ncbi:MULTISPECIES: ParB-like protein [unclassified Cupriavidus]|uniref:ParB-like protein n=1 Tax=unclassified Cupriavidus TaxID=2640874 RepID=UPI001C0061AB|nr:MULTISPECIES: ParB-like protein [unclassified Cupriavidus]MCA3185544.1 hypothetical protein [Cupriavidus sp.]MCA3188733.1 hypothetical protein [Cupriavidus sp.]MCA3199749.1 hypothetical protein [Cupriavidus sp.]MCA3205223.1 hypothetical protein [Cupriavidus sp.]MCA3210357.1 hypothetical protein [Cupriavidus sp.]
MVTNATAELATLRPTQITLGMYQVHEKMDVSARPRSAAALRRLLEDHRIQTIAGPGGALYIADHHHWARAWLELGWEEAPVAILDDLSHLAPGKFWKRMRALGHVHPYDEHGEHLSEKDLPATVMGMRDDPYRSLAAFTRNAGAYRKPGNAYGDFRWAAFFRRYVAEDMESIAGFARAMTQAIPLARSSKARRLPGFVGKCENGLAK